MQKLTTQQGLLLFFLFVCFFANVFPEARVVAAWLADFTTSLHLECPDDEVFKDLSKCLQLPRMLSCAIAPAVSPGSTWGSGTTALREQVAS